MPAGQLAPTRARRRASLERRPAETRRRRAVRTPRSSSSAPPGAPKQTATRRRPAPPAHRSPTFAADPAAASWRHLALRFAPQELELHLLVGHHLGVPARPLAAFGQEL